MPDDNQPDDIPEVVAEMAAVSDGATTLFNSETEVKLRRTDRVVVVRGARTEA